MKKLLMAAVLAGSMVAVAADAAKTEAPAATAVAAEKQKFQRHQLTEAQKAQMKARREKFMAERKARQEAMKEKMLETIKKYLPDEEKAKALADDLEKTMMSMRRPMPMGRPNMKRAPKAAPVEKK